MTASDRKSDYFKKSQDNLFKYHYRLFISFRMKYSTSGLLAAYWYWYWWLWKTINPVHRSIDLCIGFMVFGNPEYQYQYAANNPEVVFLGYPELYSWESGLPVIQGILLTNAVAFMVHCEQPEGIAIIFQCNSKATTETARVLQPSLIHMSALNSVWPLNGVINIARMCQLSYVAGQDMNFWALRIWDT